MNKIKHTLLLALALLTTVGAWALPSYYIYGSGQGNWMHGIAWVADAPENQMTYDNGIYTITFQNVQPGTHQFAFSNGGMTLGRYNTDNPIPFNTSIGVYELGNEYAFELTATSDVTVTFDADHGTCMVTAKQGVIHDEALNWVFTMPDHDADIHLVWKAPAELAWNDVPDGGVSGHLGFANLVTFPTLSNPHDLAIRYGSTDTNVAAIDNDGNVTFRAAGLAVIYAIHDFDADYDYDSVAYTLNVLQPATFTLANAEGGNFEVAGANGSKATTWNSETWAGWISDIQTHTVDGITMTTTASAFEYTHEVDPPYSLRIYVALNDASKTITFRSASGNFTRIEMTRINGYPTSDIAPSTGWTTDGQKDIWEGDAAEVTLTSCTTRVSQIVFYRAGGLSDSVIATDQENVYSVIPGASITVVATPDSAHYLTRFDNDADTNSNIAVEKTYLVTQDTVSTPYFTAKPILTLATADGGTIEAIIPAGGVIAEQLPIDTIITWQESTTLLAASHLPGFVAIDSATAASWTGAPQSGEIALFYKFVDGYWYYAFFNNGVYDGQSRFATELGNVYNLYSNELLIYYSTGVSIANIQAATEPNTYIVDYGTDVTVVATPDSAHYLAHFDNDADTNSNTAVQKTYTNITANTTSTAYFTGKPTLTLAANDGGRIEAIVPTGEMTVEQLTSDMVFDWQDDYVTVSAADMPGFASVSNAAAEAWGLATAIPGMSKLIYAIDNTGKVYFMDFFNGGFSQEGAYEMSHDGVYESVTIDNYQVYYATGTTVANVTATAQPNQYIIDYGTDVTVVATPDSAHYLAHFDNDADTNSNTAVQKTYTNITEDLTSTANFTGKPVLTLDQTEGGTLTIAGMGPQVYNGPVDFNTLEVGDILVPGFSITVPNTLSNATLSFNGDFYKIDGTIQTVTSGISLDAQTNYNSNGTITTPYQEVYSPFDGSADVNAWVVTEINPFEDWSFQAYLSGITYNGEASGTAATAGVVKLSDSLYMADYGTDVTVQAEPAQHYYLASWSDNVTPGADSTAALNMTEDQTVAATFAKNAPELAWLYRGAEMPAEGVTAYHGFEFDTIALITRTANDEFVTAREEENAELHFGSTDTNVISFADATDPMSLSINGAGTTTIYMVHDGSLMAYDSVFFTVTLLAPDTLTLVSNEGGEMTIELGGGNAVWGDGTENVILTNGYTSDGITFATSNGSDIPSFGQWFAYNSKTFTFTSTSGNFSRVEMSLTDNMDYTNWNNAEGWTVDATSAVWEGDASEVVIPRCTTYVKRIAFFRGGGSGNSADSIRAIVEGSTYAAVPGANVTVTATPDSVHYLVRFDNDDAINSNIAAEKTYAIDGNTTSTATFASKPVLTLSQTEGGVLTMAEASEGIAQLTDTTYVVDYGTTVAVQATPADHYHLTSWSNNYIINETLTDTLLIEQDVTLSAFFEKNAPELAWTYRGAEMPAEGVTAYHGFEMDTVMLIGRTANDEFVTAREQEDAELHFGSTDTNVISFADATDLMSLSINGAGTTTIYMVHDGSLMAYDSVFFTVNLLVPDTLTLATNDTAWGRVELTIAESSDSVRATEVENVYSVVPGVKAIVKATPAQYRHLTSWSNNYIINEELTDTFVVNQTTTLLASFEKNAPELAWLYHGVEMPAEGVTAYHGFEMDTIALVKFNANEEFSIAYTQENAELHFGSTDSSVISFTDATDPMSLSVNGAGTTTIYMVHDGSLMAYDSVFFTVNLLVPDTLTLATNDTSLGRVLLTIADSSDSVRATQVENVYSVVPGVKAIVKAIPGQYRHLTSWSNNYIINEELTDTFVVNQTMTLLASFEKNAPELAWLYRGAEMPAEGVTAYHGFEIDTIAHINFDANEEFTIAYTQEIAELHFGSTDTNVISFTDATDPMSLSVNGAGTTTIYMVHDGSLMAYDSVYFTVNLLVPDTLTLATNDTALGRVVLTIADSSDSVRATQVENVYSVVPGVKAIVKAIPGQYRHLTSWSNNYIINEELTDTFVVSQTTTLLASFEKDAPEMAWIYRGEIMPEEGLTVYKGFEADTIALIASKATKDFRNALEKDSTLRRVGSTNTNVITFDAEGYPMVVGVGTTYLYMVHDGSVFAYDSVAFPFTVLQPATLNIAANGNGTLVVDTLSDSIITTQTEGRYHVVPGANINFVSTPADKHYMQTWNDVDTAVNSNVVVNRTITMTSDTAITATFAHKPVLTLATSDTAWGSVKVQLTNYEELPEGVVVMEGFANKYIVDYGLSLTLVAEATEMHHVTHWVDQNADSLSTAIYREYFVTDPINLYPATSRLTFVVTSDTMAKAMFSNNCFDVDVAVAPHSYCGTAEISYIDVLDDSLSTGNNAVVHAVAKGSTTATVTATPATGYHFVGWRDNMNAENDTIITEYPLAVNVMSNYTAVFDTNEYEVVVNIDTLEGSVEGPDSVKHFLRGTYTATATPCYHFVNWTNEAGDIISTEPSLTIAAISDTAIFANFALNIYTGDTVAEECDQFVWHDSLYTATPDTEPTFVYKNVNNCDSTVTLHLTINYHHDTTIYQQMSGEYVWFETSYTESGTYYKTINTTHGCDSNMKLELSMLPHNTPLPFIHNMLDVLLTINHFQGGDSIEYIYYFWYRNGELVKEGLDADSYDEDGQILNGCYYLEIATEPTHQYRAKSNEICIGTTGIDDVENISLTLAPNPVMRGTRVNMMINGVADLQGATLTVYDAQGRQIINSELRDSNFEIQNSKFTAGIYTVRIVLSDGRMATRKLIVR